MKRRIAFGIVGIFGVLVFASLWMLSSGKSVSAMEQMAESIRTAKSYTLTMVSEVQYIPEPGKPPVTEEVTVKMFGLAPGSLRIEYLFPAERSKHPNGSNDGHLNERDLKVGRVAILSASKETIDIDHRAKTYRRGPARREQPPIMMFTELSKYSGQAKRELGTKELHGKKALGFVIDCEKVDGLGTGEAEIWIDAKSKLPIELRIEDRLGKAGDKLQMGDMRSKERLDGFEWNIDLDPKLFNATPPDGYVENTLNALPRL